MCLRMLQSAALSLLMIAHPVQAGDEEFNPSAYQIFDPTTGYFIDVEPPADQQAAAAQNHAASVAGQTGASDQMVQQAPPVTEPVVATPPAGAVPPTTPDSDTLPLLIGAGVLILLGIFAFRKRKGEHG